MKKLVAPIVGLLAPGVALAHPDHLTDGGQGLGHLFTDPFHLALSVGVVAAFLVLRRLALRRRAAARDRIR